MTDETNNAGSPTATEEKGANAGLGAGLQEMQAKGRTDRDDGGEFQPKTAADLEAVFDVPVRVSAVLGHSRMQVSDLLHLSSGTVVELDRKVGEAIDIYVNDRLVARGEVVLVEEKLGVTMTEIIKTDK